MTAWRDELGLWNARVRRTSTKVSRERAHRAIAAELKEREATKLNPNPQFSFELELDTFDEHTMTFREVDD